MDSPRKQYIERHKRLTSDRSTWDQLYRDLDTYVKPRRLRTSSSKTNKAARADEKIINNTPIQALSTMQNGMQEGITSAARPWFKLGVWDDRLAEQGDVRNWLNLVEEAIRQVLLKSNAYQQLHVLYGDLGEFGTGVIFVDEDVKDIVRVYALTCGQYALQNSARLEVDTIYRETSMTVGQMVERFGEEACSTETRRLYKNKQLDEYRRLLHVVEPNPDHDPSKPLDATKRQWKSCWLELEGDDKDGLLQEHGYHEFPVMAPRWEVNAEDVYGSSPGMNVLGDSKALQEYEFWAADAAEKIVRPPMKGPSSMMNRKVSLLSGGMTYVDPSQSGQSYEPSLIVNPQAIPVMHEKAQECAQRIRSGLYSDLWLMMADSDRRQITAEEIRERQQEKLLQLGPVMERLQKELLSKLIDRIFAILLRAGLLPPAPQALQGQELRVEYISVMAQALKTVGIAGVDRLVTFTLQLAQGGRPDALDKLNVDEILDQYGQMLGVKPDLLLPDDQVQAMRQKAAQLKQAQAQGQAMLAATQGAKNLGQADMSSDSALARVANQLPAVAAAQVQGGGQ